MSNADRLIHYQTSFVLNHERDRDVPLFVKSCIWQWIDEKEHFLRGATGQIERKFERTHKQLRLFLQEEMVRPDSVYARFMGGSLSDERIGLKDSSLTTVAHEGKNRVLWGMEYTERGETGEWLTEIGLSTSDEEKDGDSGKTVFYIRVSFLPTDAFTTMSPPNMPRIVRMLITPHQAKDAFCAHGTDSPFNYSGHPIVVGPQNKGGKEFEDFLLSQSRRCPVLLLRQDVKIGKKRFSQRMRTFLQRWFGKVDPRPEVPLGSALAKAVAGKALVFLLRPGIKLPPLFMPSENQLFLIPKLDEDEEFPSIKQYHLGNPEALKRRIVSYLYRRCPVVEPESMSPESIRHTKELDEFVELSQEDSNDLNIRNMELAIENENLRCEVRKLREQLNDATELGSMEEILRFRWLWDNLGFADDFEEGARRFEKDYPYAKRDKSIYREIFRAFCLLNGHLFEKISKGGSEGTIEDLGKLVAAPLYGMKFYSGLAMREQKMTKEGETFIDARTFPYHGKAFVFWPHLKLEPNKKVKEMAIRIHFRYFREDGKVVVGYCGPHLPTYGTQYL